MESRHCGQDKRILFCSVHNASTPCSLQAFGIGCIGSKGSHKWVREGGGTRVLNIFYYILLTIFVLFWLGAHLG